MTTQGANLPVPRGGYRGIQGLRALACLLVVAYHALEACGRRSIEAWPNGSAGVDLFFVISGFVMLASSARLRAQPGGWRVFMARRLERIVPLYWLLTLAKLCITLASPGLTPGTRPDAWNVVASLLFIPSRDAAGLIRPLLPVGWTLNFEMLFYLVFAGSLALRLHPLKLLLPVLVPLGLAGFFWQESWPALLSFANGLVLEFCFGVALAAMLQRCGRPGPAASAALLLAGAVLLMVIVPTGNWRFAGWGLPGAMMVAGAVGLEDALAARLPQPLLILGDASYAIYLSHLFVMPVLAHALLRLHLAVGLALAALMGLGIVVSAAAGVALYLALDAPVQRWFKPTKRVKEGLLF
jgi:peptidoglycan/LPS O-acetylase OafA/YrhL